MGESARCWWEAKAAADIGAALTRIKQELDKNSKADITNVIDELQQNESRLRDISDYLRIYQNREYLVKDYLDLILPSLKKTLMDIYVLLAELRTTTFVKVWNKILMRMSLESNNSLHTRLIMYKTLLMQLSRLLSRYNAIHLPSI